MKAGARLGVFSVHGASQSPAAQKRPKYSSWDDERHRFRFYGRIAIELGYGSPVPEYRANCIMLMLMLLMFLMLYC
jgi:hypothetical protein